MIQKRICSYYKHRCNHVAVQPTIFLDLPEQLRDAIYSYAGVVTDSILRIKRRSLPYDVTEQEVELVSPSHHGIFHITRPGDRQVFCIDPDNDMSEDYEIYHNLRQSSRFVCADVARYLFSNNEMLVCCVDCADLTVLLDLPVELGHAMHRLTLHLDTRSCHSMRCRTICCHLEADAQHSANRCIDRSSKRFRTMMLVWRNVIERLAASPNRSRLQLRILCGWEETKAVRVILEPLKQTGIAPVALRLEGHAHFALTRLARQAVLGPNDFARPFRFLDLPRELRLHILRFTDLVPPGRSVRCLNGTFYQCHDSKVGNSPCGEFCMRNHSVYPYCTCWVPPTPIFLVSREVLQDARTVFFESNQFLVPTRRAVKGPNKPLEASYFLREKVPREALSSLRDLTLSIPIAIQDLARSNERLYAQWAKAISFVAPHLKKLKLQLQFDRYCFPDEQLPFAEMSSFEEWRGALFRAQERIVGELSNLSCLHALSVSAAYSHDYLRLSQQELRDHEQRLEALVMGAGYRNTEPKRRI